jgi:hypothetical protein
MIVITEEMGTAEGVTSFILINSLIVDTGWALAWPAFCCDHEAR